MENFAKQINHPDVIHVTGSVEDSAKKILPCLKENDVVITMGAGDVTKIGQYLAQWNRLK